MLTDQDITLLIEALDIWENDPAKSGVMSSMLLAMLIPNLEDAKRAIRELDEKECTSVEKDLRKERAILLKAKLVQMRQAIAAEKLGS